VADGGLDWIRASVWGSVLWPKCSVVTVVASRYYGLWVLLRHSSAKSWASPVSVGPPTSRAVCRDSSVVVDGKVERSLSAHPSRYRRQRSVFSLPVAAVSVAVHFALRRWVGMWQSFWRKPNQTAVYGQRWRRLRMSSTSLEAFVRRLSTRSLIFQVQTVLRLFEGAATSASTSYPSWRRHLESHIDLLHLWGSDLGSVWRFEAWAEKRNEAYPSFFMYLRVVFLISLFPSVRGLESKNSVSV
jgi:hypothetical protein